MTDKQLKISINGFLLANVIAGILVSVVATALPGIVADLHHVDLMSWIVTTYLLGSAISSPIWAKLAERYGLREMFLLGTIIFVMASVAAGFAPNMMTLLVARVAQGLGAGAMLSLPQVAYGYLLTGNARRVAFGRIVTVFSLASVIGPLLGGVIVHYLSWRWTFLLPLPLAVLLFALIALNFRPNLPKHDKPVDFAGAGLLAVTVMALMLGLQQLSQAGSSPALLWTKFGVAIGALMILLLVERRVADPLVPLTLFRNHRYVLKNLTMIMQYGAFYFYTTYFPTWSESVFGVSSLIGGLILLPSSLTMVIGTQFVGRAVQRFGEKRLVTLGFALLLVSDLFLLWTQNIWFLVVISAIFGLLMGLFISVIQAGIPESVHPEETGSAIAFNALLRTLGSTLVLSILAMRLNQTITAALRTHSNWQASWFDKISDATAASHLPSQILPDLRQVMNHGFEQLAILTAIVLVIGLIVNSFDDWQHINK